MKLHENKKLFQDAVIITAQQKGLSEVFVEKDYWVTLALHTIFTNEIGNEAVFKGGTSLSKCFQIIERFSEDIDLFVSQKEGESRNQRKNRIKKFRECIETILPEEKIEGITDDTKSLNIKTAHRYDKTFAGDSKQIRDSLIILEVTCLGHSEPHTTFMVQSYISEMMHNQKQTELIEAYNLQSFPIRVLTKERTFCEKIMSLVKFSFSENPIVDLNYKVRHIYDIHKLLQNEEVNQFFHSSAFYELLLKVANDDLNSYKNKNAWLGNHPSTAILFSDTINTWNQISKTYRSEFKEEMVFGELPSEKDILDTLNKVSTRLKPINWTVLVNVDEQTKPIPLENINEQKDLKVKTIIENLHSMNTRELSELIDDIRSKLG